MIIVTGGAGFIGSNIIAGLNAQGRRDIFVVDDLQEGQKCKNLADLSICDYIEYDDFLAQIKTGEELDAVDAIFHLGACSATTEWNGRYMMERNFTYSKILFKYCVAHDVPLIYASSAAVYGDGQSYIEEPENERPLNVYAFSKWLFDEYVRSHNHQGTQVVGLRYFNVYGPREQHKGGMASVAYHFNEQLNTHGECRLFKGSHGYTDGEQRRDFIHVDDCVAVNLWFLEHPEISGIFNCGTGRSQSFNDVADAVINWHGEGTKKYIDFPESLLENYQSFTQANLDKLRAVGYKAPFQTVEQGVASYLTAIQT